MRIVYHKKKTNSIVWCKITVAQKAVKKPSILARLFVCMSNLSAFQKFKCFNRFHFLYVGVKVGKARFNLTQCTVDITELGANNL